MSIEDDKRTSEIARLERSLARWEKAFPPNFSTTVQFNPCYEPDFDEIYKPHAGDVLKRRIFALVHEIKFTNPFADETDEFLYRCSR
ncbi:hypothetical protein [Sphingomonas sp. Leaf242]|uniref:hypothetical protein n=1 Tax=Sphingomonas sp. Leaf242 TaxID=1736304 RepID=UPI000A6D6C1B|nr:hypothetical protein [Sphingomonas sp. Leaf242]